MVYVNPAGFPTPGLHNSGWRIFVSLMVMVIVAGLFVTARFITRISYRQLGSDDWTILGSLCMFVVQTTLWALAVRSGYGAEYLKLERWQQMLFNQYWFLGSIFWLATLVLYKTSVLLLLNRIFIQQRFTYVCWAVLIINVCWGLGNTFGWIFQCLPVRSMWGDFPLDKHPYCFDQNGLWVSIVIWDVATDLAILILPQPMIWRLSLKTREKFLLTAMFLMGAIVVIFSVMSCGAVMSHLQAASEQQNQYSLALANLFQVLESGFGIFCCCLPILRQPAKKLFPCMRTSGRDRSYYYDDSVQGQYGLRSMPAEKRAGTQLGWNSVSEPHVSRSASRRSDEVDMIRQTDNNCDAEAGLDNNEGRRP